MTESVDDNTDQANQSLSWRWLAGLMALNLIIYLQVLSFGVIDGWDDYLYFLDHSLLEQWPDADWSERLLTPEIGYPGPIPTLLYFGVHQLPPGLVEAAAHGLNLGFHLVNVVLVLMVGRRFLDSPLHARLAALLWSVHPLLAETVAWISNLKSVGMATAVLGAMLVWGRYLETPRPRYLVAAGLCLVAGLGFKPPAVVILPLLLALTLLLRPELLWRPATIGFSAITGAVTAAYLWVAREIHHEFIQEDGFAAGGLGLVETLERVGAAFRVQLENIFVPRELHPMYFADAVTTLEAALGLAALAGLVALTAWTWFKCRAAAAGLIFFWMNYLPHSGIEYLPRFTADTYMYLPLLGLLWAGLALFGRLEEVMVDRWSRVLKIGVVATVFAFSMLSFAQTARWSNPHTLWSPVLEEFPEQYPPYHMVGQVYFDEGEYEDAVKFFEAGLPYYQDVAGDRIMALGYALERSGRPAEALDHMVKVLSGHYVDGDFVEPAEADQYTLYLVMTYELSLPEEADRRGEVLDAARSVLEAGDLEADHARSVAEYLEEHDEPDLAQQFRDHAQRR